MPKPKIDLNELAEMLNAGKTQTEAAKYFKVSNAAVSLAKKKIKDGIIKNIVLESAHRVVKKNLDAISQLQKINEDANEILDLLMRWNRGDSEALQILESQVATKKVRVGDQEEFVKEYKMKDPRELALKAMAEIRGQLNLQLEIFKTLYDMRSVEEFQGEVLSIIGEVSKDVRKKIIARLRQRRAVRSIVSFD